MGQSINVSMYGCRVPPGVDVEALIEQWDEHVAPRIEAYRERLAASANEHTRTYRWRLAEHAYVPTTPNPDDSDPDSLVGFYVCHGQDDDAGSHHFSNAVGDTRREKAINRCRRRWSRFARWARAHGVEFGKPRVWHTRTEVA